MPKGVKGFQKGVPAWSKGVKLSDIHKERIGLANKGKKRVITDEWRANMSKGGKGRKFSLAHRKNLSLALKGEKSSGWRGGVTKVNRIIRGSFQYKLWRRSVLERDGHKCIWCGSSERLDADHIKPFSLFPELRFAIDNGRTLCRPCHETTDTYCNKTRWKLKQ